MIVKEKGKCIFFVARSFRLRISGKRFSDGAMTRQIESAQSRLVSRQTRGRSEALISIASIRCTEINGTIEGIRSKNESLVQRSRSRERRRCRRAEDKVCTDAEMVGQASRARLFDRPKEEWGRAQSASRFFIPHEITGEVVRAIA
jgi:hypothetical protein